MRYVYIRMARIVLNRWCVDTERERNDNASNNSVARGEPARRRSVRRFLDRCHDRRFLFFLRHLHSHHRDAASDRHPGADQTGQREDGERDVDALRAWHYFVKCVCPAIAESEVSRVSERTKKDDAGSIDRSRHRQRATQAIASLFAFIRPSPSRAFARDRGRIIPTARFHRIERAIARNAMRCRANSATGDGRTLARDLAPSRARVRDDDASRSRATTDAFARTERTFKNACASRKRESDRHSCEFTLGKRDPCGRVRARRARKARSSAHGDRSLKWATR